VSPPWVVSSVLNLAGWYGRPLMKLALTCSLQKRSLQAILAAGLTGWAGDSLLHV